MDENLNAKLIAVGLTLLCLLDECFSEMYVVKKQKKSTLKKGLLAKVTSKKHN